MANLKDLQPITVQDNLCYFMQLLTGLLPTHTLHYRVIKLQHIENSV